jgi:hypothetical protein
MEETLVRIEEIIEDLSRDKACPDKLVERVAEILRNGDPWYLYLPFYPVLATKYGWRGIAPIPNVIMRTDRFSVVELRTTCTVRELNRRLCVFGTTADDRYGVNMIGVFSISGRFNQLVIQDYLVALDGVHDKPIMIDGSPVMIPGIPNPLDQPETAFDPMPCHIPRLEHERFTTPLFHIPSTGEINSMYYTLADLLGAPLERPFLSISHYGKVKIEPITHETGSDCTVEDDATIHVVGFNVVAHLEAPEIGGWVFNL